MSGIPLSWKGSLPPVLAARGQERAKAIPDKLTFMGAMLFLIGLTIATSAFDRFRIPLGTMKVHLYLFVMAPFLFYSLAVNLRDFPTVPLAALLVFTAMYVVSTFSGGKINYNEAIKILASVATLITGALMVRSEKDFRAGVIGLSVSIGVLAFFNLETADKLGRNLMDTGNKNAYSLYALPAILLSGYVLIKAKSTSPVIKLILIAATFGPLVVIFMGANRSGWAGCVMIALMLTVLRGFSLRGVLLVAVMGYACYFAISNFGATRVFEYRVKQTLQGNYSDDLRKSLFFAGLQIGLDNPVAGVSPQLIDEELGRELGRGGSISSHNVVADLVGGSGLICSGALLFLAITLWRLRPRNPSMPISNEFKEVRKVLRAMLILWLFRGMFTAEILYSPSFSLTLGLALGLCLVVERREQSQFESSGYRLGAGLAPVPAAVPAVLPRAPGEMIALMPAIPAIFTLDRSTIASRGPCCPTRCNIAKE